MPLKPAVFLDRDGTLNKSIVRNGKPYPPQHIEEFELIEGVTEACTQLKKAGFLLVVVTNQPDVGRGIQSQTAVEVMHRKLKKLLPEIDHIEVCYAPGKTADHRRKPEPGMIEDAASMLGIDLATSWMIGDRWRDVECGKRAGIKTIFIDDHYDEVLTQQPDFTASSFPLAVDIILTFHASIK
ncbi:MAG: HAD family hydrolase [Alphaproteobacteria bacterium]|nr:HAD family hydrolase [Alphaproteobacteria bacterium]